ncbi:putative Mg2+ transporter-C (MgtC) family protein [Allocatelliglobosispora scoriae]|uniref:Putative Mg2+ transporter-C (MgtC) family protein n=1 Tax=Allocatelliglobosispora scoriae TaxID=643052 RepID=A0A841BPV6_9ACTN|nr:MgtC/SapB family protein [Allocatelliglobosispora scoriae]MBB5869398.1 putative Mg2+ transporter-C (MgtC) family protein [Allocatelliglobosispora scoriae]
MVATNGQWIVILQIAVAAVCGAAIGLEREMSAQPAGLRTHMLVSLGAALFTLAGAGVVGSDPTRIAAQVVTGIGFLGGGAILREGATVRGLTTAASLWVTAAIGLAAGLRWWFAAIISTVLALAVLWVVKRVEREVLPHRRMLAVTVTLEQSAPLDEVEREVRLILPRSRVLRVSYTATGQALVFSSQPHNGTALTSIGERVRALPGVHGVEISR